MCSFNPAGKFETTTFELINHSVGNEIIPRPTTFENTVLLVGLVELNVPLNVSMSPFAFRLVTIYRFPITNWFTFTPNGRTLKAVAILYHYINPRTFLEFVHYNLCCLYIWASNNKATL